MEQMQMNNLIAGRLKSKMRNVKPLLKLLKLSMFFLQFSKRQNK